MAGGYSDDENESDDGYDREQELMVVDDVGAGEEEEEEVDRRELFLPVIQSLVTALGGYEEIENDHGVLESIYRPGDSVLSILKDLKKLWRKDDTDDERTVARLFYECKLAKELIGLLVECSERGEYERKIALASVDILTALTWPIDVAQELKELADDHEAITTDYASLIRAQVEYKAMLLRSGQIFRCVQALLAPSLVVQTRNRSPQDKRIISLMLHFIRNLVAIRDPVTNGFASTEEQEMSQLQSNLIVQLEAANLLSLLPTIGSMASQTDFNEYNVIVLDSMWCLFRGVDARELAQDLKKAPAEGLTKLLDEEENGKRMGRRNGVSRHSRFGTTIALKAGSDRYVLHKQDAVSKSAGAAIDGIKKSRAVKTKKQDELAQVASLSGDALQALQSLALTCIEAFNAFFHSIWKDIRMGRSKVRETDNLRTAFLARFFIEFFLVRQTNMVAGNGQKSQPRLGKDFAKANDGDGDEEVDSPYLQLSEVLQEDTLYWLSKRQNEALEAGRTATVEVQACMDLHTSLLLLLDAMSKDSHQYIKDVASDVSHRFYYFQDLETKIFTPLAIKSTDLSIAYLESSVSYVHTFLRMLENFSKSNEYLFVRRRRRKKQDKTNPAQDMDEEENIAIGDEGPSHSDHKIVFDTLVDHLGNDQIVHNLMTLLSYYQNFHNPDRLKQLVGLMHRVAVKMNRDDFFFKVSALSLFKQILDNQRVFADRPGMKDLFNFINFVLRKFFKSAQKDPSLIVHAFFPKPRSSRARRLADAESDEDSDGQLGRIRALRAQRIPADLEIRPEKSLSWSQQLGVALRCLLEQGKMALVTWIVEQLTEMAVTRREIVLSTDGPPRIYDPDLDDERPPTGPSADAIGKMEDIDLIFDSEERLRAATFDPHFKLLLRLSHCEPKAADPDANDARVDWFMPKSEMPDSMESTVRILEQYLRDPFSLEGDEEAKDLLRKKRKKAVRRRKHMDSDDNVSDEAPHRKRRRKQAEIQQYKSAQFIEDSDEDPNADAAFYAKEAERRERNIAKMQLGQQNQLAKKVKPRSKRQKANLLMSDSDSDSADDLDGTTERRFNLDAANLVTSNADSGGENDLDNTEEKQHRLDRDPASSVMSGSESGNWNSDDDQAATIWTT